MPSTPPLSAGATVVVSDQVTFAVAAGETKMFEPGALASTRGAMAPPCALLVWTVAWRATGVLSAAWYHQTAVIELGQGHWGTADLGCAGFELRNESAASISGELAFVMGSRQP